MYLDTANLEALRGLERQFALLDEGEAESTYGRELLEEFAEAQERLTSAERNADGMPLDLAQSSGCVWAKKLGSSYWFVFDTAEERADARHALQGAWCEEGERSVQLNYVVEWRDAHGYGLEVAHSDAVVPAR